VGAISRSVLRLTELLDSLLDYSKAQLGSGLPLEKCEVDLINACEAEIELLRAAHPVATIEFSSSGPSMGFFDAGRIREALANLVSNAVQYRSPGTAIRVSVQGDAHDVTVTVINQGEDIPSESLHRLFEPLRRRELDNTAGPRRNLGIGLFVVREIAKAHGGEAGARASDGETTFFVRVPRQADNEDNKSEVT
jgi:signal transduction histidine kinase